jgi:hypothetical protein
MLINLKVYEPSLGQFRQIQVEMDVKFRSMVSSRSEMPILELAEGDAIMVVDTKHLYVYVSGEWSDQGVCDISDLLQERLMQDLS